MKEDKRTPIYIPFAWYIGLWIVYMVISVKLRFPLISYSVVGVIFYTVVSRIYEHMTRRYLFANYRESCLEVCRSEASEMYNVSEAEFSFRSFQYAIRHSKFSGSDEVIQKIYRNNVYESLYFYFMMGTIAVSFLFYMLNRS